MAQAHPRFPFVRPRPSLLQTTNDPETDPALQAGSGKASYTGSRDPYVPSKDLAESLEKPKSREEVSRARCLSMGRWG